MAETFDHIIHRYGRPAEGPALRLDHELQAREIFELDGQPVRVVSARSEDREYGRIRIVTVEDITGPPPST